MKRSEMLSIIWEAINELEDANHILTRLEEAGMKPPIQRDPDGYSCGPGEWEPEND